MAVRKYIPLDVILEQPSTRLLRGLRRFDWVTPLELFAAVGIPDWIDDGCEYNPERNAASAALGRLAKLGLVDRGRRTVDGYEHKINASGLRELGRRLRGIVDSRSRKTCGACGGAGHYRKSCEARRAA